MAHAEDELRDELRTLGEKIAVAKQEIREADGLDEIHKKEHLEVLLREQKEVQQRLAAVSQSH
jgi:hypothetical protein